MNKIERFNLCSKRYKLKVTNVNRFFSFFLPKCVVFILHDAVLFSNINRWQFKLLAHKRWNIPIQCEWPANVTYSIESNIYLIAHIIYLNNLFNGKVFFSSNFTIVRNFTAKEPFILLFERNRLESRNNNNIKTIINSTCEFSIIANQCVH